ncbi:hypothetical protein J4468_00590 [Candidatus Woesearchaeota archaeon]|nr:hypothetical protein [Candidatus Woesearchaeota archaeon]
MADNLISATKEIKFIFNRNEGDAGKRVNEVLDMVQKEQDKRRAKILLNLAYAVLKTKVKEEPERKVHLMDEGGIIEEHPIVMHRNGCSYQINIKLVKENGRIKALLFGPQIEPKIVFETRRLIRNFKSNDLCHGNFLASKVKEACLRIGFKFNESLVEKVRVYIIRDLLGFGRIEPLLYDPRVRFIKCDGPGKFLKIGYADYSDEIETNVIYPVNEEIELFVKKIILAAKKRINLKQPIFNVQVGNLTMRATIGKGRSYAKFTITRTIVF